MKVSDNFVEIILNLFGERVPTKNEISNLKLGEKEIFDILLIISGLHKNNIANSNNATVDALKNRLELIEGQIQAGNDNKELLKDLYTVLYKLNHIGAITVYQAREHYKLISKAYFK
jgi:hypothetical protein